MSIKLDGKIYAGFGGRQGPRGETGPQGSPGPAGKQGPKGDPGGFGSITASVGKSTGDPHVEVTQSGPDTALNIDFAFTGLKGEKGEPGQKGDKGDRGEGVPDGGADGQVLTKTSSGTAWSTMTAETVGAIPNTYVKSITVGTTGPYNLADGEVYLVYET